MLSRLNYTDRRKIPRKSILLESCPGDEYAFSLRVDTALVDNFRDADVFVDITSSDNRQVLRQQIVTNKSGVHAGPYATGEIPCSQAIFDFKVVSRQPATYGRILRRASGLRTARRGQGDGGADVDLLRLAIEDLGERFWDLRLGDPVTLLINERLGLSPEQCVESPVFASLVFPEVCRRSVEWAAVSEGRTEDDLLSGATDAATSWFRFAAGFDEHLPAYPPEGWTPENRGPLDVWIAAVVDAMANQHGFVQLLGADSLDVFR